MTLMCGTVYRDSLRSDLRNTSKHATALEQTSKEDRRRKLEGRLNQFHQKAGEYMGNNAEEDLDVLPKFTGQEDEDENQEDVSDVCEEDEEDKEEGNSSEATIILMPSSMKREDIQRLGLETLAAQELELRKGQAGDCRHWVTRLSFFEPESGQQKQAQRRPEFGTTSM